MAFFSILMSVYNGADFIEESVKSIITQTFTDWELIIINDGSTDTTLEILEKFTDPRITIITQDNIGLTKSLIKAFAYSDGKWIARHDADDISLRNRFEILHGTISNTNGLNFVHSQAILIDKVATAIYPRSLFQYDTSLTSLIFGNFIVHGSIAIRREVLEDCGYDEKVSVAQDYDLYCRLKKKLIKAHLVPVPLYLLRRGTDSISSRRAHDQSVSVKTACRDTFSTCVFLIKYDTRTFNRTLLKLLRASFLIYKLALKKTSGKRYR